MAKNAVAVAVIVLCCVTLRCAVLCGAVWLWSSNGTRRRDSGAGSTGEACWGIIIQVLELGSNVLGRCPVGAGENR